MPAAMNKPLMNCTSSTSAVKLAIPVSLLFFPSQRGTPAKCRRPSSPALRGAGARRQRGSAALLLVVGSDLLDLLLGLQHVLAVGAGHVLEPLERILGIGVGDASVVRERRLAVEITHRDVAQQGFVPGAAQGGAELEAVGRAGLL